jgi:metal-sulfur cluster biosynthetic enzyme
LASEPATENAVREALREVIDPEAGMNIVDLGLVYRIDVDPVRIAIDMTMTTPACPVGPMMVDQVKDAVRRLAPDAEVAVTLVWEPPWSATMMSEKAKKHFGW